MKKQILFFCCVLVGMLSHALTSPKLIGLAPQGGSNNSGTLIKYIGGDSSLNGFYNLPAGLCPGCGANPSGSLLCASDGKLYGLSYSDGSNYSGTLFSYDANTGTYTVLVNFNVYNSGTGPEGSLMQASNGLMYGLTSGNGAHAAGTLFSYQIGADSVIKLVDMPAGSRTARLNSLIQSSNGKLYGMTTYDGVNGGGTIFEYNIGTNTYTVKYNLARNASPFGDLLEVGTDTLYGLTYGDGTYSKGTLFRYVPASNTYTVFYNFDSVHGGHPESSLVRAGNGKLYGTAYSNGSRGYGVFFSFDPVTHTYTDVHDFTGGVGGAFPEGSPYVASDGQVYGMTVGGGTGYGTIYRYNVTTGVFSPRVSFTLSNGGYPSGALTEYARTLAIVTQPSDQSGCIGSPVTFHSSAVFYTNSKWQISTDGGITFSDITGATDSTYTFPVTSYSQSGYKYRIIYRGPVSSDTSVVATLSVYAQPLPGNTTATICAGQNYTVGTHSHSTAGTYTDTIIAGSVYGCDSILTTQLSVYSVPVSNISAAICQGRSYTVGSYSHSSAGTYSDTLRGVAVHGCDSIVVLQLAVYSSSTGSLTASFCQGQTYIFNGHNYHSAGTYNDTILGGNSHGCDSIVTLHLSYYSAAVSSISAIICPGTSYAVGPYSHTTAGTFSDTLRGASSHGCDSVVTLHLSIYQQATGTVNASICPGRVYTIGTHSHSTAGIYSDTLRGASIHGCDSIVTLNLTVYSLATGTVSASICQGRSYVIGTHVHSAAGTYTDTLPGAAVHGCDSIVTLNLSVYPAATGSVSATICQGRSYVIGTHVHSAAGIYIDTLPGAAVHGCDSIVTLNLSIYAAATGSVSATICQGRSYVIGTHSHSVAGTYIDTLPSAAVHGCDSIVTLNLSVYPAATGSVSATICPGRSYVIGTHVHSAAGTYTDTLSGAAVHGCDSIVTLNLNVYASATNNITASICLGQSYSIGTFSHNTSGVFRDTLRGVSVHGCDSIVTLHLTVYSPAVNIYTASICQGQSYVFAGHTYSQAGSYSDTLRGASVHGCDSINIVRLSVYAASGRAISASICQGHSYTLGANSYTAAGTYIDTLHGASMHGCDSIVTLTLSVYAPVVSNVTRTICQGQSYSQGGHIYTASGRYVDTLAGASVHGCDSIVVLDLSVYGSVTNTITTSICPRYSYTVGGHTYTASGTYIDTLHAASIHGCDSIVTLNLILTNMNDSAVVSGTLCTAIGNGAGYQWLSCSTHLPVTGATSSTYTATANGSYQCVVTLGNCTDTTNCVTVTGVGIDDISAYSFSLYPNPTNGSFVIEHNYKGAVHLQINSILGERMKEFALTDSKGSFDLSDLASGMYEVQISDDKQVLRVMKLVKE